MIEIREIYLIKTVDKSPYVWTPDPDIFDSLVPSTSIDLTISSLVIDGSADNLFHLDDCFTGYLDYDVEVDFESQTPRVEALSTKIGTSIYNYRFALKRENPAKEWSASFKDDVRYLASHNWQIIYKSGDNWFINYAEFQLVNTKINNDAIQPLIFEAEKAKEEIYNILSFGVV